ncbi:sigma-70 family RNA polymerase sigma factor, partial [candidate division KSB1 bacterium]|nr:sigma-70 family RNA polymerase sigma factor [candidate division KSB1 bacterium]
HGDYLYGYAMSRVREPEAAEELVQEALLAALQSRDKFAGKCSERTWLVSILKHKIIDHYRRSSRRANVENIDTLIAEPDESFQTEGEWKGHWKNGAGPLDWGSDPYADLEKGEFWQVFQSCLADLPPRLAQVFTLREIEAYSSAEVCEILNITESNLWVMLHRARTQLRKGLERRWFEGRA